MNNIYYLYSESGKSEALFLCYGSFRDDENNPLKKPLIRSNTYALGTIFLRLIKILENFPDTNNPFIEEELLNCLTNYSCGDVSFINVTCEDKRLKDLFSELFRRSYFPQDRKVFGELINQIETLISRNCHSSSEDSKNKKSNQIEKLNKLIIDNNISLPQKTTYLPTYVNKDGKVSVQEIFEPKEKNNFLRLYENLSKMKEHAKLKPPMYVFEIEKIQDLLLICLQLIFKNNYAIGKCRYCGDFFVYKNMKKKYCPIDNEELKKDDCYHRSNRERVLKSQQSQTRKMEKSVRAMYAKRYDIYNEKFQDLMREIDEWRCKIKLGEATDEEFEKWLETKYVYKFKK